MADDNLSDFPLTQATTQRPPRRPGAAATLRQKTLVKLREAIMTGQLQPDHRLVERDVCVRTGVSRSSVREALRYLESEGLVESRGTKGMFVVKLSIREAKEIYELRMAVEAAAAENFARRATDTEIAELQANLASVREHSTANVDEYWRQADLFFDIMMRGARNDVAYSLMRTLRSRIRYLRATTTRLTTQEYRQGTVDHLTGITEALVRRDGPAAAALIREFVARSSKFAVNCLRIRDEAMDATNKPE